MNDDERDDGKDHELGGWLRAWNAAEAPERLRDRLKASYRSAAPRASVWERLHRARVSLSLPAAALVGAAVLALGVLAGRHSSRAEPRRAEDPAGTGLANLRPLSEVRITILKQGEGTDASR